MTELLQELKAIGVEVMPQGDNLAIRPASKVPPELKERLRAHKAEVLAILKAKPARLAVPPERNGQEPAPCGTLNCAGCYSIGTIDGRERFVHPPKLGDEYSAWLARWQPPEDGKPQ